MISSAVSYTHLDVYKRQPKTGLMPTTIEEQTKQSLDNILNIVHEAGFELTDVVKCHVYLKDLSDFARMNEVYANFF